MDGPVVTPPPPRSTKFLVIGEAGQVSPTWSGWFRNLYNVMKPGISVVVVTGGTTLTFKNGLLVSIT